MRTPSFSMERGLYSELKRKCILVLSTCWWKRKPYHKMKFSFIKSGKARTYKFTISLSMHNQSSNSFLSTNKNCNKEQRGKHFCEQLTVINLAPSWQLKMCLRKQPMVWLLYLSTNVVRLHCGSSCCTLIKHQIIQIHD